MKFPRVSQLICGDARFLDRFDIVHSRRPRAVITSPPYLDTQDYGFPNQIGHGQTQEQYLKDLRTVFQHCWNLSSEDATMWLVLGAVRRNGKLVQLPEVVTGIAGEVGWIPREQITWAKGKSLPWARTGEFRDVTEQAILLSKSDDFPFNLNDLLSPDPSSPWWKRYPERYSPLGRRPTNLWDIPIPTQGSWKPGPGHLCPFPNELTFRMLTLSTGMGDLVLDPFAGIGSVPAMAEAMGRVGIGVDLAERYVNRFEETLANSKQWYKNRKKQIEDAKRRHDVFYQAIVELRLLKYGAIIAKHLIGRDIALRRIHVRKSNVIPLERYKIAAGEFEAIVGGRSNRDDVLEFLTEFSGKRPLSKFGIAPMFRVSSGIITPKPRYWYEGLKFWDEPKLSKPTSQGVELTADFAPPANEVLQERGLPLGIDAAL